MYLRPSHADSHQHHQYVNAANFPNSRSLVHQALHIDWVTTPQGGQALSTCGDRISVFTEKFGSKQGANGLKMYV